LWGCEVEFRFPIVKLLDWASNVHALETDANPFAVLVLADLKTRETRKDPLSRKEWKFRIVRGLFERGWTRENIRQLFRLIDWMMDLPEPLALEFDQHLFEYEKEKAMPYVTSVERHGIEKGRRESSLDNIQMLLEHKFGADGAALLPRIREIGDVEQLRAINKAAITANTLDEIRALLP
jgi:hypothetical protein